MLRASTVFTSPVSAQISRVMPPQSYELLNAVDRNTPRDG